MLYHTLSQLMFPSASVPVWWDNYLQQLDVFVTRLRTLNKTCDFGEQTDEAIRDQVIDKCVSKELHRRLLRELDIDLSRLLTISRIPVHLNTRIFKLRE